MTERSPTFIFLGPSKVGSTWLYTVLAQHPDCFVPPIKDLRFFSDYYGHGAAWYLKHFRHAEPRHLAVGELSNEYLAHPDAPRRIRETLGDVKVFAILRNPIDQLFSHYLFQTRSGLNLPLERALEVKDDLIGSALYSVHLANYLEHFDRENLGVFLFEDLKSDSDAFLADVYDFIGVPQVEGLDTEKVVLPASRPRHVLLSRSAKLGAHTLRALGLAETLGRIKSRESVQGLFFKPYKKEQRPELPPGMRDHLRKVFSEDVARLRDLVGLPFDPWDIP